jgi:hypothetical protein
MNFFGFYLRVYSGDVGKSLPSQDGESGPVRREGTRVEGNSPPFGNSDDTPTLQNLCSTKRNVKITAPKRDRIAINRFDFI